MRRGKPLSRSSVLKSTTGLERKPGPKRKSAPKPTRQQKRDWSAARAKVDREGECRLWGGRQGECEGRLEAAHLIGRDRDSVPLIAQEGDGFRTGPVIRVAPERIVPLCARHHGMYDRHEVDLLGRLHLVEELQAVADSRVGWESGIECSRRRLAPLAYKTTREPNAA